MIHGSMAVSDNSAEAKMDVMKAFYDRMNKSNKLQIMRRHLASTTGNEWPATKC